MNRKWEARDAYRYGEGVKEIPESAIINFGSSFHYVSMVILFLFMAEHIISYIFSYVKKWDLRRRGEVGASGIESTPLCMTLDGISFFMQCIFSLMAILHFIQMGDLRHNLPLVNYYLMVDLVVTLLFMPYCYFTRHRQVSVNVMRNIFTLNAV